MISRLKKRLKEFLHLEEHKFNSLLKRLPFNLEYEHNKGGAHILEDVFIDMEYAGFLPRQAKNIVDIGAHYGYFSLYAAFKYGPNSRIFSFEPSPDSFYKLGNNLQSSQFKNVVIFQKAISNKIGHLPLYGNKIENYNILKQGIKIHDQIEVTTLKNILLENSLDEIDILKLDCEGSEYEIILDSPESVLKKIKFITMEFHDRRSDDLFSADIITKLTNSGMEVLSYTFTEDQSGQGLKFGKIIARRVRE